MPATTRMKRSDSPAFWGIPRKANRFAPNTSPGPHPKMLSIPLTVLVRDILKLAKTAKEVRTAVIDGGVSVDGVVRNDPNFPVGLMDVVDFPALGKAYRIVPTKARTLYPIEIPDTEKGLKLCTIKNKITTGKDSIQYALHDGRSILTGPEISMKVSDCTLIEVPSQKVVKHVALKKDSVVIVTGGERQGEIGKLNDIKQGTVSRPRMANVAIDGATVEIPAKLVMVVGEETPLVTVGVN